MNEIRNEEHIDNILGSLKIIWSKYLSKRFGQLLCSCIEYPVLYQIGDESLVNLLSKVLKIELKTEENKIGNGTWNKGRVYVNNGKENKAIKESELQDYLNKGFVKGRK